MHFNYFSQSIKSAAGEAANFLYLLKGIVYKFEHIAKVDAPGEQGDGYLGDDAGVMVFDKSIIAADVDDSTEHSVSL